MKSITYPVLVIATLIGLLFLDHYVNHGDFYDWHDFQNAVYNLIKSHEGLIILSVIINIGIIIGLTLK